MESMDRELARKCNDHTWMFFEISSCLRYQVNLIKQAHYIQLLCIHLPINIRAFLSIRHTKATLFLAFSFSLSLSLSLSLSHAYGFSKFFGKKNHFLQTSALLWKVSILTSQRG